MVMRRAGSARPDASLAHRLVGQADDGEGGQTGRDLHLHVDGAGLDALERHGGYVLDHDDREARRRGSAPIRRGSAVPSLCSGTILGHDPGTRKNNP